MEWDPFQREVLEALGHTLFVRAEAGGIGAPAAATRPPAPAAPQPAPAPVPAATTGAAEPLRQAIARAAGIAVDALPPDLPLASLRGNPAAKRALWPRLRAMRGARR